MRVSIVTVSLNQARFLPRAIASVLSQDYPDIEYIVVDPGSSDGSRDIIERQAEHFARVVFEPDVGPADGLNHGFQVATGEVFAYVNADDVLLPHAVRDAVAHLSSHPDTDVVYGDGYMVDVDGNLIAVVESSPFNLRRFAYGSVMVLQQATFIRRSAFDRTNGFNVANRTCWDGELLVDIAITGGRLEHVAEKWGAFALYPETITGSQRYSNLAGGDLRRMFRKALGRDSRASDVALRRLARLEKWLVAPGTTLRRARSAVMGPPAKRLVVGDDQQIELVVPE